VGAVKRRDRDSREQRQERGTQKEERLRDRECIEKEVGLKRKYIGKGRHRHWSGGKTGELAKS
jgi:hypothetical protein